MKPEDSEISTQGFSEEFANASISEALLDYAHHVSQTTNGNFRAELREELLSRTEDKLDDEERKALVEHLDAVLSRGLKGMDSLDDSAVLARELMRFPLTRLEQELLVKMQAKEISAVVSVPIAKRETQYRGEKEWIDPGYRKCPAIQHFPLIFGTLRPSPRAVEEDPSCSGLIYDRGVIACKTYHSTCPHFWASKGDLVLCAFDFSRFRG